MVRSDRIMPIDSSDARNLWVIGIILFLIGIVLIIVNFNIFTNTAPRMNSEIFGCILGFVLSMGGLSSFYIALQELKKLRQFKRKASTTIGTVESRYSGHSIVIPGFGCGCAYYLIIHFKLSGKLYQLNTRVDKSLYNSAVEGKQVTVTYMSSNPCYFILDGEV